ncbi:MAG: hypothetical protein AAFV53_04155 [Myxococcota bacterium]
MNFESLEDVQDPAKIKASLSRLKRISSPARFMFKSRSKILDGQPLLLLASPGRRVSRALAEELKEGSATVWGEVIRVGQLLLFTRQKGGRPPKKEMTRLISQLGREAGVALPQRNIAVVTPLEFRAVSAMERSLRQVRRVRKPAPFIINPRWAALGGNPAFIMGGQGRDRSFALLRGGGAVEGTVMKDGKKLVLVVEKGSASASVVQRALVDAARIFRISAPRPEVRIGEGASDVVMDEQQAAEDVQTSRAGRKGKKKDDTAPTIQTDAPKTETPKKETRKTEVPRKSPEEIQREREERARKKAEADKRRAEEAERQRQEEARARQEAEAARRAAEDEATRLENERRKATLPALKKQLARAESDLEDAREDLDEAREAFEIEQKAVKEMRGAEDLDDLRDQLSDLQEEFDKPDKDIRKLQSALQRVDDLEDALEEVTEFFEERADELKEELDEMQEEFDKARASLDELQREIEEIEAL